MNAFSRDFPMSFEPGPDTQRDLRDAFAKFATGVTVITCKTELGPVAITANSFSSISLDPALVMWAAGKSSRRYPAFSAAKHYAIHVMAADQNDLCMTIAKDGFALKEMEHHENEHGVPLLRGCLARFECSAWAEHDAGDHAILLGKVERAALTSGDALAFFGGKFTKLAQP